MGGLGTKENVMGPDWSPFLLDRELSIILVIACNMGDFLSEHKVAKHFDSKLPPFAMPRKNMI